MTKAELIKAIQENLEGDVTKKSVSEMLDATLTAIGESVSGGDKLILPGFGTFTLKERAARKGVNPRKRGETIDIPASKTIGFKPSKVLKEKLNQ